jgi:hypothetical protein
MAKYVCIGHARYYVSRMSCLCNTTTDSRRVTSLGQVNSSLYHRMHKEPDVLMMRESESMNRLKHELSHSQFCKALGSRDIIYQALPSEPGDIAATLPTQEEWCLNSVTLNRGVTLHRLGLLWYARAAPPGGSIPLLGLGGT